MQNVGDLPGQGNWFANGEQLGTVGSGLRLEAIEVRVTQRAIDPVDLSAYYAALAAVNEEDYTKTSWAAYQEVVAANVVTEANTYTEVETATRNIIEAQADLVRVTNVSSVQILNSREVLVTFSGPVDPPLGPNFSIKDSNGLSQVFVATKTDESKTQTTLTLSDAFKDGGVYAVVVTGVKDATGELVADYETALTYTKGTIANVTLTRNLFKQFTGTPGVTPYESIIPYVKVTDTQGRDVTKEIGTIAIETTDPTLIDQAGYVVGTTTLAPNGTTLHVVAIADGVRSANIQVTLSDVMANTFVGAATFQVNTNPLEDTIRYNEAKAAGKANAIVYTNEVNTYQRTLALYYTDQLGNSMDAHFAAGAKLDTANPPVPVSPAEPTFKSVTPAILVVNADGELTPLTTGTGRVQVTVGEITTEIEIEVKKPQIITSIEVSKKEVLVYQLSMGAGSDVEVTYRDQYGDLVDATPNAYSNNTNIANIERTEDGISIIGGRRMGTTSVIVKAPFTRTDGLTITSQSGIQEEIAVTVVDLTQFDHYKAFVNKTELNFSDSQMAEFRVGKMDEAGEVIAYALEGYTITEVDRNGTPVYGSDKMLDLVQPKYDLSTIAGVDVVFVTRSTAKTTTAQDNVTKKLGTAYVQVKVGSIDLGVFEINITDGVDSPLSEVITDPAGSGIVYTGEIYNQPLLQPIAGTNPIEYELPLTILSSSQVPLGPASNDIANILNVLNGGDTERPIKYRFREQSGKEVTVDANSPKIAPITAADIEIVNPVGLNTAVSPWRLRAETGTVTVLIKSLKYDEMAGLNFVEKVAIPLEVPVTIKAETGMTETTTAGAVINAGNSSYVAAREALDDFFAGADYSSEATIVPAIKLSNDFRALVDPSHMLPGPTRDALLADYTIEYTKLRRAATIATVEVYDIQTYLRSPLKLDDHGNPGSKIKLQMVAKNADGVPLILDEILGDTTFQTTTSLSDPAWYEFASTDGFDWTTASIELVNANTNAANAQVGDILMNPDPLEISDGSLVDIEIDPALGGLIPPKLLVASGRRTSTTILIGISITQDGIGANVPGIGNTIQLTGSDIIRIDVDNPNP